jgi:hypothetical protein
VELAAVMARRQPGSAKASRVFVVKLALYIQHKYDKKVGGAGPPPVSGGRGRILV